MGRAAMRWYYKLPLRLRSLFRNQQTAQDLSDEIQFHLQHQIDEYVAQGMDPKEARRPASRLLGGLEQIKEECRERLNVSFIHNFSQDICFESRILRRIQAFSPLAFICLTLTTTPYPTVFTSTYSL